MTNPPTGRLLLRPDAYRVATPTGLYALTHEGECGITGASIARWVQRLAPALNGTATLTELLAGLPEDRARQVRDIVLALCEHGLVREVTATPAAPVTEAAALREHFVGYFRDDPAEVLQRYARMRTVVVGREPVAGLVARAARCSGLTDVSVRTHPGELAGVELVLHVFDADGRRQQELLERRCAELGIPLAAALVGADDAWLQAAVVPGDGAVTLGSAWPRYRALNDRPTASFGSGTFHAAVAHRLVQGVFTGATGVPTQTRLVRIAADTLHGTEHRYVAPPRERLVRPDTDEEFGRRIAALRAGPWLAEETFSARCVRLMDARLGVFTELTEGELVQLPVQLAETTVSDPVGLLGGPLPGVLGAGKGLAAARLRAAHTALAVYGTLMLDPRRLTDEAGRPIAGPEEDPRRALRRVRGTGFLPAVRLSDDAVLRLPARLAFPVLDAAGGYPWPCGAATGHSWSAALTRGLLGHCRRLLAGAAAGAFPLIDPAAAPLDAAGWAYAQLAGALGTVTLLDLSALLGVPAVACRWPDGQAAIGCGASVTAALRDGLQQLLLGHQSTLAGRTLHRPARVRGLDAAGSAVLPTATLDVAGLLARLAARGHRFAAVPLDHDPEVAALMPYTVQVVSLDA